MGDRSERALQALILNYLASQRNSVSDADGLDVAVQCIAEAFGISDAERTTLTSGMGSLLNIFRDSGSAAGTGASHAAGAGAGASSDGEIVARWQPERDARGER